MYFWVILMVKQEHSLNPALNSINILVTVNANYIRPLKVMLNSLFLNNPEETFNIYLIHTDLKSSDLSDIDHFIKDHAQYFFEIKIPSDYFKEAPVLFYYTKEMYYRLLAYKLLPESLSRILYLDPDILVLNSIKELYSLDMDGYLFAAAYHDIPAVKKVNRIRLNQYDIDAYYNSGVLLMNLDLQREQIQEQEIFDFVLNNQQKLIMPDQDILNALFAKCIKALDEIIYNYDVRYYHFHKINSNGKYDIDFIIRSTVFLHFCGRKKPWNKHYAGKFEVLYKHYQNLALS